VLLTSAAGGALRHTDFADEAETSSCRETQKKARPSVFDVDEGTAVEDGTNVANYRERVQPPSAAASRPLSASRRSETSMNQSSTPAKGAETQDKVSKETAVDASSTALKEGIVAGVHDISTEVKHLAGDVAEGVKKAAELKVDAGKDFAAEQLGAFAGALRETGRQLRQGESGLTEYVEKAARSVDGVSTYLQTRTLSQLISDVEGYARREPAVFLGGAFFVGLLGGRFLKSATPAPSTRGSSPNVSRADASRVAGALGQGESKEKSEAGASAQSHGSKSKGQNGGKAKPEAPSNTGSTSEDGSKNGAGNGKGRGAVG
jgi:uncharacterized phage infection (PIP) family protein YhgE